jgi:hypothetical protein
VIVGQKYKVRVTRLAKRQISVAGGTAEDYLFRQDKS